MIQLDRKGRSARILRASALIEVIEAEQSDIFSRDALIETLRAHVRRLSGESAPASRSVVESGEDPTEPLALPDDSGDPRWQLQRKSLSGRRRSTTILHLMQ